MGLVEVILRLHFQQAADGTLEFEGVGAVGRIEAVGLDVGVHGVGDLLRPETNLEVQSAVIAGAEAFVGTYGGFSYLAPLMGVNTVAFYSHPTGFRFDHLDVRVVDDGLVGHGAIVAFAVRGVNRTRVRSGCRRPDERIRAREVRLIGPDGSQVGIRSTADALTLARELDLDLVEVAAQANPPVCRIMDYGKFKYEEAQKAKESRKKTSHVTVKEVKFRPKIGKGDFDTKVRHMHDFLADGHKVKVTLQFRGREMAHPELGSRILDAVLEQLGELRKVETQARLEGRNMTMVLGPNKAAGKVKKASKVKEEA